MSAYPPVTFPPPPPTSNTLSSHQRSALVRSAKKLSKILGDVPRVLDDNIPRTSKLSPFPSFIHSPPHPALPSPALTRTRTLTLTAASSSTSLVHRDTESTWRKRKPTHLPPLIKPPTPSIDAPDSPISPSLRSPMYHHIPTHRGSVLSIAPSIVSNAPSTASSASFDSTQRLLKIERLRRKLGNEVPATAVFPTTTPHTPKTQTQAPRGRTRSPRPRSRSRSRSVARLSNQADDARSVAFSINSDESVHTVTFTAARVHSPRPHRSKHVYMTGPLPPVPPIPAHLVSTSSRQDEGDQDAGLVRPRLKMAAGSRLGGSDFKAARRAKREGRAQNGMAEPGELVEMVGFLRF